MNSQTQDLMNIYKIPINRKANITRQSTTHKKSNSSLPTISFSNTEKINNIRRQVGGKKQQVALLKARIHALKYQRERNEKKKQKNQKQVEFLRTIKQRFKQDRQYKNHMKQHNQQLLEQLRKQRSQTRQQMIYQRQLSKSIAKQKKFQDAKEERSKRKYDQQYIQQAKSIQVEKKKQKVKSIRQEQHQIEEKMKSFYQSRVQFARKNHLKKVQDSVKDKKKINRTIDKLRQEENRLMQDCKKSQAQMLTSLYQLQKINPQKKKKGYKSKRSESINSIGLY